MLKDDIINDVDVVGHAALAKSQRFQSSFVQVIDSAVVGKNIDDANIDVLAGASKTSATFNKALSDIRKQAHEAAMDSGAAQ